jgi:hypothetical protein
MNKYLTPGMKTSEFYVTVLATLLAFLASTGIIGMDDANTVVDTGTEIIKEGWDFVSLVAPSMMFILSRGFAKSK